MTATIIPFPHRSIFEVGLVEAREITDVIDRWQDQIDACYRREADRLKSGLEWLLFPPEHVHEITFEHLPYQVRKYCRPLVQMEAELADYYGYSGP
jgi:hypothetical protein